MGHAKKIIGIFRDYAGFGAYARIVSVAPTPEVGA